jgi:excisionase family DNA binding protein
MQTLKPTPAPAKLEFRSAPTCAPEPPGRTGRENAGVECWRVERVARYLDVSRKRVYQLVQEKKIDAIRLGPRQMRILQPSIERYLAALLAREEEGEGEG